MTKGVYSLVLETDRRRPLESNVIGIYIETYGLYRKLKSFLSLYVTILYSIL